MEKTIAETLGEFQVQSLQESDLGVAANRESNKANKKSLEAHRNPQGKSHFDAAIANWRAAGVHGYLAKHSPRGTSEHLRKYHSDMADHHDKLYRHHQELHKKSGNLPKIPVDEQTNQSTQVPAMEKTIQDTYRQILEETSDAEHAHKMSQAAHADSHATHGKGGSGSTDDHEFAARSHMDAMNAHKAAHKSAKTSAAKEYHQNMIRHHDYMYNHHDRYL